MDWVGFTARRVPWALGALALLTATDAAAERVVFINLNSVVLNSDSGQDPTLDSYSSNGFTPGTASGFALSPEDQALLHFYLKEATAPFDIEYVFERPASGAYDMVAFGSETDADTLFADSNCPPAIGLADCGDGSAQNISFVFQGCLPAVQQADMRRIAYYALTGLGFGWGLENESTVGQIMGTYSVFGLQFGSECAGIVNGTCPAHPGCPAAQQNATEDLNVIVGARVDDGPPAVTITAPINGATVDPAFAIEADVLDAFGGLTVVLSAEIDGMPITQERAEPPYVWDFNGVPPGNWTFDVQATDADGSTVTASVDVTVSGASTGGDDSTTSGGDGSGDGTSNSSPGTSGDPTSGDPTDATISSGSSGEGEGSGGAPIDPTEPVSPEAFGVSGTGCQCRADPRSTRSNRWGAMAMLGLLGLGLSARRRRGRTYRRPSRTSTRRDRMFP